MSSDTGTLFISGHSLLHKVHPYTKLIFILLSGSAAYLLPWVLWTGIALAALNLIIAAACRIALPFLKFIFWVILPLALFMLPIHGFLYPDNHTPLFCFHGICVFREGLIFAGTVLLRLTVVLGASLLFVFTTHPADLITAVSQSTGSSAFGYLIGTPLLLLPSIRKRTAAIQSAQKARGMEIDGNIIRRLKGLAPLVIPLVLGALMEIEQRTIALELKGFKSKGARTSLRTVKDSFNQKLIRRIMLTLCAGIVLLRIIKG